MYKTESSSQDEAPPMLIRPHSNENLHNFQKKKHVVEFLGVEKEI